VSEDAQEHCVLPDLVTASEEPGYSHGGPRTITCVERKKRRVGRDTFVDSHVVVKGLLRVPSHKSEFPAFSHVDLVLSVKTMPKDKDIPTLSPNRSASGSRPRTARPKKLGGKSKRNVAAIIGLRTVTGRSIAYAAVQASAVYLMHDHADVTFSIVSPFQTPTIGMTKTVDSTTANSITTSLSISNSRLALLHATR
jgi:hypothetical protein